MGKLARPILGFSEHIVWSKCIEAMLATLFNLSMRKDCRRVTKRFWEHLFKANDHLNQLRWNLESEYWKDKPHFTEGEQEQASARFKRAPRNPYAVAFEPREKGTEYMIKLFHSDDGAAVVTDAKDEREFIENLSKLLAEQIPSNGKINKEKLSVVFRPWLEQSVDICCKMRGYKAEKVRERRVLIAGDADPRNEHVAAEIDEWGDTPDNGAAMGEES